MASLKNRRLRARGLNSRIAGLIGSRTFRGIGNRATLTTALAGANNDITLIAQTPGTAGNSITLTIAVAGASTPLSVAVVGNAITVNSATTAGSAASSTAAQIVSKLNFTPAAKALVWAQVAAPGNDGTGTVVALGSTALTGGVAYSS